jgi:hypothetical protein
MAEYFTDTEGFTLWENSLNTIWENLRKVIEISDDFVKTIFPPPFNEERDASTQTVYEENPMNANKTDIDSEEKKDDSDSESEDVNFWNELMKNVNPFQ